MASADSKKVIQLIPYYRLEERYGRLLGDVCPDYVLEREVKELFALRERRIISQEELKSMCGEAVGRRVNGGISGRYIMELEGLIEQHRETQKGRLTAVDEEGEDLVCMGARYGQLSMDYLVY